jgi:glycosyltransferase involved in cell wall biosynthesis
MSDSPQASVVIPVYNGQRTIGVCLRSIFEDRTPNLEVIVVDDGSTDQTASVLSDFPCRVIKLPENKGRGYARNRGVEAAQAPYVLLTDADCVVSKGWALRALAEFQALKKKDGRIVGAAGRILPMKGFFNKCDAFTSYGYNQNLQPDYTDNFCTSNLIVERDAIVSAGLFDESLPTFEDLDLGLRILAKGGRLYYAPKIAVYHNHTRLGIKGFLSHEYEWGRSIGNYFELKYPRYRWTPISRWMHNRLAYLMTAPLFAFLITLKIIATNFRLDPSVVFLAPFIFTSKILFRVGALEYMARRRMPDYTYYDLKTLKVYGTRNRSRSEG